MEIALVSLFPVPKEYGIFFAAQYREFSQADEKTNQVKQTSPEEKSKLYETFKGK